MYSGYKKGHLIRQPILIMMTSIKVFVEIVDAKLFKWIM